MQAFNELLKTQMMLSMGHVSNPLTGLLALNGLDIATRTFPTWSGWISACWCRRAKTQSKLDDITIRSSIVCERDAAQPANRPSAYSARIDAIIHHVTTLPAMKSLLSVANHDYLPNEFEPVVIDVDVYFELIELKVKDGQPEIVKFKLFCYEHDVQHIQMFIDSCKVEYERCMANKLGSHRYFFDQMIQTKVKGSLQNQLPVSHLIYTKTKFNTNRSFENVFFEQREKVKSRTKFFLNERGWYDKKGIPYTLGFMFHGTPGTGKTSTIKAIAHEGRRHIMNIQLSEIKSKQQLQHLFFNDEIHVHNGSATERYVIPVSERLYVIEDIDAMGDMVARREWKLPTKSAPTQPHAGDGMFQERDAPERETIDLAFLLNLLDGTLEANGRILIITTNFPERIDRALVRPGRVDMIVEFKKCSVEIIQEMADAFYDKHVAVPSDETLNGKWSPAEVNQILFQNFDAPEEAIRMLQTITPAQLYGEKVMGSGLDEPIGLIEE